MVEKVLRKRESLVNGQLGPKNIKDISQQLLTTIRSTTGLSNLGNNREQFVTQFLLPALRSTHNGVRGTPGRRVRFEVTLSRSRAIILVVHKVTSSTNG